MHPVRLLVLAAFVALQAGCAEEPVASPDRSAAFEEGTALVRLTDENFATEVLQCDRPVLVDAWAKWCQPCVELQPTLRRITADFSGKIKVGQLDVDANPFVVAKYEIDRYPTLILFVAGQEAERVVGVPTHKELTARLRRFASPAAAPRNDQSRRNPLKKDGNKKQHQEIASLNPTSGLDPSYSFFWNRDPFPGEDARNDTIANHTCILLDRKCGPSCYR